MSWRVLLFVLAITSLKVQSLRSADELKLKKGDTVTAVVKATEVMIQKD